jgi:hypothetical protein
MSTLFLRRQALAVLPLALLAACSTPVSTVSEPQRHASARDARIFILRPRGFRGAIATLRVKLNDIEVGSVANGSYIMVVRPAGRYTLNVRFAVDLAAVEHTFDASAGRSYYFVYNSSSAEMPIAGGGFFTIPGSAPLGREVGSRNPFAEAYLSELEPAAGAAAVAAMQAASDGQRATR